MKFKNWMLLGLLAFFAILAPKAHASTGVGEVDAGCEVVAFSLSLLGGYALGAPFGTAAATLTAGLAERFGSSSLSASCRNYYRSLERIKNEFDYDTFVRTVCNGNPYACPNGLNSFGDLPQHPASCAYYIVCTVALAVKPADLSLSVKDIINAGYFVDISNSLGYWDVALFGSIGTGTISTEIR